MILSDTQILQEIEQGNILIEPFDMNCLGTNSYDVHLGRYLAVYKDDILDARNHNKIELFEIPRDGFVLHPNRIYLGVTREYTETLAHVPSLEGKSSVARLGIHINSTSNKGNVGFCNTWTLEISVVQPVRIYAGMPIGQLFYMKVEGDIRDLYHIRQSANYNERTMKPVESMLFKSKF
ncbi:dCTP deaminase [Limibacter armeniacum]|uniref:dCTP deaminase n=1 Tax=Limibacter armeniacum TaxID=466084 RepID=UPI002FE5E107